MVVQVPTCTAAGSAGSRHAQLLVVQVPTCTAAGSAGAQLLVVQVLTCNYIYNVRMSINTIDGFEPINHKISSKKLNTLL